MHVRDHRIITSSAATLFPSHGLFPHESHQAVISCQTKLHNRTFYFKHKVLSSCCLLICKADRKITPEDYEGNYMARNSNEQR